MTPHTLIKNQQATNYQPTFASPLEMIEYWTHLDPSKVALIYDQQSSSLDRKVFQWSYDDLNKYLKKTQQYLNKLGITKSLAFCFDNSPEIILLNFASWSNGLLSVPLDATRDTIERKIYKLKQAKTEILFTRSNADIQKENSLISQEIPNIKIVEIQDIQQFLQLISLKSNIATTKSSQPKNQSQLNHPALILYTSGTTALPKGAVLTWKSLMANAQSISDWLQFDQHDRWLIVLPLHHINSTTFANTVFLKGGTAVLVPHYSKSKFWETLAHHQITGTSIVPTIAFDQLSEQDSFLKFQNQLTSMRRIQIGSAPVQPSTVKQFLTKFNIKLFQGYGQTETSLRSTGLPTNLTPNQYKELVDSNSIGTELSLTNVTILRNDGQEASEGEVGAICIRGPIIMDGYLNNVEATEDAFQFNWFNSGDLGYWKMQFGQRFFYLQGRDKEIIKKGGVLISPLAIENALLQYYPQLQQVYVIGYPNTRMGEEIGFVAISEDLKLADKIIDDSHQNKIKTLAKYELPSAGIMIQPSQLPLTSTGKVQRVEIKNQFQHILQHRSLLIAQNQKYLFRAIEANEQDILNQATKINNQRWGKHLSAPIEQFTERASHGILIGIFDKKENLLGTISGLQLYSKEVKKIGQPNHWANTWDGITSQGKLHRHNHKGDCVVWVAISIAHSDNNQENQQLQPIRTSKTECPNPSTESVSKYCHDLEDPVLKFHAKTKGGLPKGATIRTILPNSRKTDWESLGYCVLMKYPNVDHAPTINIEASKGTQLLEAAMLFAFQRKISQHYAYSRPVGLHKFFCSTKAKT